MAGGSCLADRYIRQFASHNFSYNGVDITDWSAAESAAAIVAASIPFFRVLVRERDKSKDHARGLAEIHMTRLGGTQHTDPRNVLNQVWITANKRDDDSDRSILRENQPPRPEWGILQTQTIIVDTHSETRRESISSG